MAAVKFAGSEGIKGVGRLDVIDEEGGIDDRDEGIH
jgi:hypothetical protein